MRDGPLLSICVPTYGRLPYLKELLAALLPQVDDLGSGSVEVCVSDNASPDGTGAYLASIVSPSLRFWTNETNIGGDRNFLKCIQEARGEYVWLLGDDELLPVDAVSRVVAFLDRHRPGLLVSSADAAAEGEIHTDYAAAVRARPVNFPLLHTLISANVFKRTAFAMEEATTRLKLSYAHMFGMMWNLAGERIGVIRPFVTVRPVRAVFERYPSCLCVKQAIYLLWAARRFGLSARYRFFALRMACNLPFEYASRVKGWMVRKGILG